MRSRADNVRAIRVKRSRVACATREAIAGSRRTIWRAGLVGIGLASISTPLAALNLADINGENGFVVSHSSLAFQMGASISNAGDINGDGVGDFLVGATNENWVVFGRRSQQGVLFPAELNLTTLDGRDGFAITNVGNPVAAVAAVGDVNGDGFDDLAVGAGAAQVPVPNNDYQGETYVIFGKDTTTSGDFPASLGPGSLNGSNGFIIRGRFGSFEAAGVALGGPADINGDGLGDIIVDTAGVRSYVVFGRDTQSGGAFPAVVNVSDLNGDNGFVINTEDGGYAISEAGDVSGDGVDDIIIGRWAASPDGRFRAGRSYVVFGRDTAKTGNFPPSVELADLDGKRGFVVDGLAEGDGFGRSVSGAGDVNGDGVDDLLMGAINAEVNGGSQRYIIFGRNTAVDGPFPANFGLSSLNGENGFVLDGVAGEQASTYKFNTVSGAGDVNADGIDDIILGSPGPDFRGPGGGYVVFGKDTAVKGDFPAVLHLRTMAADAGFVFDGVPGDQAGSGVSGAGDVNADGIDDFIVGASSRERAYVVYGRANVSLPARVQCLGDIDNDGITDIAMVTPDGHVQVKALNGHRVGAFDFESVHRLVDLKMLPDSNGNGAADLLGLNANSMVNAEVLDALTGAQLSRVAFEFTSNPLKMETVEDQNGNGVPEVAVLGHEPVMVEVRDALSAELINRVASFSNQFQAKDLAIFPDLNGSGAPELAVLGENNDASGSDKIEVRDLRSAELVHNIWLGEGWHVLQQALLADRNGNGSKEVAVLRVRDSDGAVDVTMRDTRTRRGMGSIGFDRNYPPTQLLTIPDVNGNGADEVVVFGQRFNGGNQKAQVKDSKTRALVKAVFFDKHFAGQDMATCADINGNGSEELVLLGKRASDGKLRAIVKDARTGELIGTVDF